MARIARELRITRGAVSSWTEIPIERVADVARITGIPARQLCPSLAKAFDAAADA